MNKEDVVKQARWELEIEQFEEAVKKEKERLLKEDKSFLKNIFKYRLKFVRIDK